MSYAMKALLSLAICFSMLVSVATAQSWTVTPGEGVGAVTVDASPSSLETVVKSTRKIGSESKPLFVEYTKALIVEFDNNRATTISLHENAFGTKNGTVSWVPYKGAAIGSSWNTVAPQITSRKLSRKLPTAKGHPEEIYHAFPDLGIGFRVKGGAIAQVDIWKAR